ncbi:signal peptidase I [Spartinivicinus poritis]|uniref:Signal peptidase I n=1 Tax=Spartinivicinus poritis TaxID=2994640 RepID=A0ABT5U8K2_9GAMM|nr:signal peptidase I [Spartinivicinus sp. A2-2]MDE1462685.1 signal peptidase I [Spartinivicinus sp. A2-2]
MTTKPVHQLIYTCIFIILSYSALITGFITKHHWLGIHIYFVPSMSMYPTLKPGQFILLDTWVYQSQQLKVNDVVVFQHGNTHQWLVKRITQWPNGKLLNNGLLFMQGDNQNNSHDSRSFGGIKSKQVVGQVKLVLLGIDYRHHLLTNSYLHEIH